MYVCKWLASLAILGRIEVLSETRDSASLCGMANEA